MAAPDLHIVSFAVPYPADYGGAIDAWSRMKALEASGVNIHLHCFVYKHFKPQPILKQIARQVHYYPRVVWPALFLKGQPFIVSSRRYPDLLKNLTGDKQPVFFEGVQTTGFIPELKNRNLLLRAHNIEHEYYAELAKHTKGFRSLIYSRESQCLEVYERTLATAFNVVFAISSKDNQWYLQQGATSVFLPPFHGHQHVDIRMGRGEYLLYQGDLSLEINQVALLDLIHKLPEDQLYPVVIAGKAGDKAFEENLARFPNLRREADVSDEKMVELIQQAQVVLIHSLHGSGMKLKIFPALYFGKFVAATDHCKTDTVLDEAIYFYAPDALGDVIHQLWSAEFTREHLQNRTRTIAQHPDDLDKAKEIMKYL